MFLPLARPKWLVQPQDPSASLQVDSRFVLDASLPNGNFQPAVAGPKLPARPSSSTGGVEMGTVGHVTSFWMALNGNQLKTGHTRGQCA